MLRSSGPSDTLAPPSPYPQQIEPSPTDSNGTESTDIEEDAQEEAHVKSPFSVALDQQDATSEIQSPDIEIRSPASAKSVRERTRVLHMPSHLLMGAGQLASQDRHKDPSALSI